VREPPHGVGTRAEERQPCHDKARHHADQKGEASRVAEQDDLVHREAPVRAQVTNRVPGEGQHGEDADGRVQQDGPLREGAEREEPDGEAAGRQQPEGGEREEGEARTPGLALGRCDGTAGGGLHDVAALSGRTRAISI
jgi:hypothetical protein